MNCYLCKDAGHGDQPAHRILPGGKGVCRFHYEGSLMPAETPGVVIPAQAGIQEAAPASHIPAKETALMRNRIDLEKVRELHGQGLNDREIGEKLGCSGGGVFLVRRKLGLVKIGKCGPRKSKGNGTVGDAMARLGRGDRQLSALGRKPRAVALAKAGAHVDSRLRGNDKNGDRIYGLMIEELTAQRNKLQAAIDALSELSAPLR
jgi:hypothetical protein